VTRPYWACNRCGWQTEDEAQRSPQHRTMGGELCGCPHFVRNNGPGQRPGGCACHGTRDCLTPENAAARKAAQEQGGGVTHWRCAGCWGVSRLEPLGACPRGCGWRTFARGTLAYFGAALWFLPDGAKAGEGAAVRVPEVPG
jgi:hypothetical protein